MGGGILHFSLVYNQLYPRGGIPRARGKKGRGRALHLAMLNLGFSYLGLREESMMPWGHMVREFVYFNEAMAAFAGIQIGRRHGYYFITPLSDGSVVMTTRFRAMWISADKELINPIGNEPPDQALTIHQKVVARRAADGVLAIGEFTRKSRLATARRYYASAYVLHQKRLMGGIALVILTLNLCFFSWMLIRLIYPSR